MKNGLDDIAEAVGVLINKAMKLERSRHLNADLYKRETDKIGYANGYKTKTLRTRIGEVELVIPQTRRIDFYLRALNVAFDPKEP